MGKDHSIHTGDDESKELPWRAKLLEAPGILQAQELLSTGALPNTKSTRKARKEWLARLDHVQTKTDLELLVKQEQAKAELMVKEEMLIASKSQEIHEAKDKKGIGRVGNRLQAGLSKFAAFLESYAGIVEVMKQADLQYGSLAYSVLSGLLIVMVNKTTQEDNIRDYLTDFDSELARLSVLRSIAPTQTITNLLVTVYMNVLKFASSTTMYYTRSGFGRVIFIAFHPPKRHLNKLHDDIIHASEEIYKEITVFIVRGQAKECETRNRNAVEELGLLLGDVDVPPEELGRYRAALDDPAEMSRKYTRFDFDLLKRDEAFVSWKTSPESSLFLLKGRTMSDRSGLSWLSPAAINMIALVGAEKDCVVTYDLVNTSSWVSPGCEQGPNTVIAKIVWQLLNQQPQIMEETNLVRALRSQCQELGAQRKVSKESFQLLSHLLSKFPKIYVIIDRLDRCKCDPVSFIDHMMELIVKTTSILKIFIVLCQSSSPSFDAEALEDAPPCQRHIVTMDQNMKKQQV